MLEYGITYFLLALLATSIGAVPFGLVNLSVVDTALKNNPRGASQIAHGASVVEVLFALSSLLAGTWLSRFFQGNASVKFFVFAVLIISGLFFWFKKNGTSTKEKYGKTFGFLKGAALNIVSIQVLLFWLLVATVLSAKQLLPSTLPEVIFFVAGVWLAKMAVLKIYAILAIKVLSRAQIISANVNRIIGVVLLLAAIIQLIKI